MRKFYIIIPLLLVFISSCFLFKQIEQIPTTLQEKDDGWVNTTLINMSLDQKIGQMIMPFAIYNSRFSDGKGLRNLKKLVSKYHVGGFVIRSKDVYTTLKNNNELQALSKIPLFIAGDYETGVGGRTNDGTEFISMMGVGATNNPQYAYDIGKITALESRAIGVNLLFAPSADVNSNPLNKIINTRSFGENPETVGKYVAEFVKGAQENGILATVKHFPGHGGTSEDSHYTLPVLNKKLNQLQTHELVPFIDAIKNDVAAIMTSHISLPLVAEDKNVPATLSWKVMDELLREKLHYDGLIITDALAMDAVKNNYFEGQSIVKAIHAGNDILLVPKNIPMAFQSIRKAVRQKEISIERINQSVKRILTWKSRLDLNNFAVISDIFLDQKISSSFSLRKSKEISRKAITVIRNEILPIKMDKLKNVLVLNFGDRNISPDNGGAFVNQLQRLNKSVQPFQVTPDLCQRDMNKIVDLSHKADAIINNYFFNRTSSPDQLNLSDFQMALLDSLSSKNDSVINIFFGSPYYAMNFPYSKNMVFTYKGSSEIQRIAAEMITGKYSVQGKLPVSIPNIAKAGEGDNVEKYAMQLEKVDYKRYVKNHQYIDSLKTYLKQSIADGAFPGCAVAVGHKGKLLLNEGFGNFTYDSKSKKVETNSIYDLASVTKVVSTTSAAMLLYDRGLLDLNWKVQDILTDFLGKEKGLVTVKHLLTHTAGLPAWKKYYLNFKGQENILQQIYKEELVYTPGTLTMYSDLGMILTQKIIEVITQKPLNVFNHNELYKPLGMDRTFYNPEKSFLTEIVPTEKSDFHKRVIRGFVHDENTFAMGGVSGHAGLFSTSEDLATFCQMMLNKGLYNFEKVLSEETINYFTKRDGIIEGSTRAIGWDTRSEEKSSSGHFMSMQAFGHTGFTGTSLLMDPENEVFVVLLTNRVHPTRENQKIRKVRPMVADYVMKAIFGRDINPIP
jgi:beta-N-acetylhexosaminidase